ncbi:hypothetical protein MA16_Dca025341 [Dendrobium catenatum]|uniref:Uncharacterized protein n=1 Tax=Dendrobium catenatum TaxID=906689 RepID=A0A2I0XGL2_9ASPA|nr:hypothetical protein MA16_Dca025341 [Dendrobium catenatum]
MKNSSPSYAMIGEPPKVGVQVGEREHSPEFARDDAGTDSRPQFPNYRGRSNSKNPTNHVPSIPHTSSRPPRSESRPKEPVVTTITTDNTPSPFIPTHTNSIGLPLHYQAHSPPPSTSKINTESSLKTVEKQNIAIPPHSGYSKEDLFDVAIVASIPNLNIPTEEISESSSSRLTITTKPSTCITTPNKFEILNSQIETEQQDSMVVSNDEVVIPQKQTEKRKKQTSSDNSKKSAKGKQSKKSHSKANS